MLSLALQQQAVRPPFHANQSAPAQKTMPPLKQDFGDVDSFTVSGDMHGSNLIEQYQDDRFERDRTRSPSGKRGISSFNELLQTDAVLDDLLGAVAKAASGCPTCATKEDYEVYLASYFLKSLDKSGADYAITKKSKATKQPEEHADHPLRTQALDYHSGPVPGKYTIVPTKPMDT